MKSWYKVMFLDVNGKAVKTVHVQANDYSEAESKAEKPKKEYERIQTRKKEGRTFI